MEADHDFASCYDGVAIDKVPYGCWFFYAKGSGIYIDVGKTLIGTVDSILRQLSLEQIRDCLQSYVPQNNISHGINVNCIDKYYCSRALTLGYDSVQIMDRQEIVICSGKCATHRFDGACPPVRLYRRKHSSHGELSIYNNKHEVQPSSHDATNGDDDISSNYEDCQCDDSTDVMNCGNNSYTFHHIHNDKSYGNSSVSPIVEESTKVFNLTLTFGSRLLDNKQYLIELSHMCQRINDWHLTTNSHPVLVIDIESYGASDAEAYSEVLSKVIPTPRQLAVLKEMDDLQRFRLLGSGGYYPHREKSDLSDHLYNSSTGNCLLYMNLVGMRSTIVVEINQVRVGIIDLTSQTISYLHEDGDRRILLVGVIRRQAQTLRDEENVHVVVLIIFADFATSSFLARHTKEQVSLILGIHYGGEVANCYGKFYDVDTDRVIQVPFSSMNYSKDDVGTQMNIGTVDIVGRMRSSRSDEDTDYPRLRHEVEFSIRSETIGQYRILA